MSEPWKTDHSEQSTSAANTTQSRNTHAPPMPTITLPKGGGAIRGVGETFSANPVTGSGSLTVPIATTPGRQGFGPSLALSYDSGAGNGPFGFGWQLELPAITRKTDNGLPRYQDALESDVFLLSDAEDLVPVLAPDGERSVDNTRVPGYRIHSYRPRIEGLFARIERWTSRSGDVHWRTISRDNILTIYGMNRNSRLCDPDDPLRIWRWLICESRDDKGNAVLYEYKAENGLGVDLAQAHERHRGTREDQRRSANRYLKRVCYGNETSLLDHHADRPHWLSAEQRAAAAWMFEVVFDYGEHDIATPTPNDPGDWHVRVDAFSHYRAGFEIRTTRLCRRVLMFHHCAKLPTIGSGYDGLVRSTDFTYAKGEAEHIANPAYSFLRSATHVGYQRDGEAYLQRSLPPLEFTYSLPIVHNTLNEIDPADLENMPVGIDQAAYQWIDLHGEGTPGVLTEQANAWFYKRNISPLGLGAAFAPIEQVALKPNEQFAHGARFVDLAGDGLPDLVALDGPTPGMYEHDNAEGWQPFRPFAAQLNRTIDDPNLRLIDLNGDGHVDVLITEDDGLVWHESLAEAGFGPAQRITHSFDQEHGPRLVFADAAESIYLADMSGDGLTDLVRIRNGEVCYWPNMGYGRFGAQVIMDYAPWFDQPDLFAQARIRLTDIDGSGTTDIVYLHRDGVRLFYNQSGNSWSGPHYVPVFPQIDDLASMLTIDLLGNGTTCLVWSSALPGNARSPLRYVSLMGAQKPHLLTAINNNLGAETRIDYAPSTKFYLQDKHAGNPWMTRLPFPVHVVERVSVHDKWRQTTFSTTYSYHHGYFDGHEREFRGFGRVEQTDVEAFGTFAAGNAASPYITGDKTLYQPPVQTVTWFHTGAVVDGAPVLGHFRDEYFSPPTNAPQAFREHPLPEPDLSAQEWSVGESREALRACKHMPLRQEVYELDVDALERGEHRTIKLFSAAEHAYDIRRVQAQSTQRHAVFLVVPSESITYQYELDLQTTLLQADPRVTHTLNMRFDEIGNIEQAVTIGYGRWQSAPPHDMVHADDARALVAAVQAQMHMVYAETRYTTDAINATNHRLRLPCETLAYEVTGIQPARYFALSELRGFMLSTRYQHPQGAKALATLAYHEQPSYATPQRRLIEHTRHLFWDAALAGPLALGTLDARALVHESVMLALTSDLLAAVFGEKLTPDVLATLDEPTTSGYLADATGELWQRSGSAGFNADAPQHFFLPERFVDAFGATTTLSYDRRDWFVETSSDPLGNTVTITQFDYRVGAPARIIDMNGAIQQAQFDALGMPVVMVQRGAQGEGDMLADMSVGSLNPDQATFQRFFAEEYSEAQARDMLGGATARYLYSFGEVMQHGVVMWGVHPACSATIMRQHHATQQFDSPLHTTFAYTDGMGTVLLSKAQAEPALPNGPLRWITSGKTVLNNKGKPVKQYEPYFSPAHVGHRFAEPDEIGVTPLFYYDAPGRLIRSEAPDGSFRRVVFSPWHVAQYDANDTLNEPGNAWLARMNASNTPAERRAAQQALAHAATPQLTMLDSLNRDVIVIAQNRVNGVTEQHVTFTKLDAEGKPLWVQDALGRRAMQYVSPAAPTTSRRFDEPQNLVPQGVVPCYDIAGNLLFQRSMDAGDRWMLPDAAGQPLFGWNSRGFRTRTRFDRMRRPVETFLLVFGATTHAGAPRDAMPPEPEILVEKRVYGEDHPETNAYLRGKLFRVYDTAGVATNARYDFKGNVLISNRRFAREYKAAPDWSPLANVHDMNQLAAAAESLLEPTPPLISRTTYDALNRPTSVVTPDQSVYRPLYNAAGLLEHVDVNLRGAQQQNQPVWTPIVTAIEYNAKGQRERIVYANGAICGYSYDPLTFRLANMQTTRPANADPTAALFKSPTVLQDLRYTYDAVGNITCIDDLVLNTTAQVGSRCEYRYDALYRLIGASGREHSGQTDMAPPNDTQRRDYPFVGQRVHANDLQGLRGYVETYRYDAVGNMLELAHHAGGDVAQPGQTLWQRRYQYALDSNRMRATSLPADPDNQPTYTAAATYSARYDYDAHGNITRMPHLPLMRWDFNDRLCTSAQQVVNNGVPETTYYVYDATGQRLRKITETQTGARKNERLYHGGYEIYREYRNNAVALQRETLHVMDDTQRVALIETQTTPAPNSSLVRFQLANHLGSASIELDSSAALISYEEYHPYGTSAFQAGRNAAETSLKRYRYTAKERDSETGFAYHGARYYAPWLARWASCDPAGLVDGVNLYRYARNAPTAYTDSSGLDPDPANQQQKDDDQLKAIGVTRQQVIDFATMTRGDFLAKHGGGSLMGELRLWWNFPKDKVRALPTDMLARILPKQDQTIYIHPSGRVGTNASETVAAAKEFSPGTPIGGVTGVAAYGVARAVGASDEDSMKALQIGSAVGGVIETALPAKTATEELVPPRAGGAYGPARTYIPHNGAHKPPAPKMAGLGPQPPINNNQDALPGRVKAGELKTLASAKEAKHIALSKWAANLKDTELVAAATYDAHGNITLDIYLAGGNQDLVWHNDNIGHVDPADMPRGSEYQSGKFGTEIEPGVTRHIRQYLGQYFSVKHGNTTGNDFVPAGQTLRFNLLKK